MTKTANNFFKPNLTDRYPSKRTTVIIHKRTESQKEGDLPTLKHFGSQSKFK